MLPLLVFILNVVLILVLEQKEIDELKAQLELIMKMMQSDMSDKTDDKKADDNEKPVKLSMATVK